MFDDGGLNPMANAVFAPMNGMAASMAGVPPPAVPIAQPFQPGQDATGYTPSFLPPVGNGPQLSQNPPGTADQQGLPNYYDALDKVQAPQYKDFVTPPSFAGYMPQQGPPQYNMAGQMQRQNRVLPLVAGLAALSLFGKNPGYQSLGAPLAAAEGGIAGAQGAEGGVFQRAQDLYKEQAGLGEKRYEADVRNVSEQNQSIANLNRTLGLNYDTELRQAQLEGTAKERAATAASGQDTQVQVAQIRANQMQAGQQLKTMLGLIRTNRVTPEAQSAFADALGKVGGLKGLPPEFMSNMNPEEQAKLDVISRGQDLGAYEKQQALQMRKTISDNINATKQSIAQASNATKYRIAAEHNVVISKANMLKGANLNPADKWEFQAGQKMVGLANQSAGHIQSYYNKMQDVVEKEGQLYKDGAGFTDPQHPGQLNAQGQAQLRALEQQKTDYAAQLDAAQREHDSYLSEGHQHISNVLSRQGMAPNAQVPGNPANGQGTAPGGAGITLQPGLSGGNPFSGVPGVQMGGDMGSIYPAPGSNAPPAAPPSNVYTGQVKSGKKYREQ